MSAGEDWGEEPTAAFIPTWDDDDVEDAGGPPTGAWVPICDAVEPEPVVEPVPEWVEPEAEGVEPPRGAGPDPTVAVVPEPVRVLRRERPVRALVELILLAVVAGVVLAAAIGITGAAIAFLLRQFASG